MMIETTIAVDFDTGLHLSQYPGILSQVQVGADFYVGQVCYIVRDKQTKNTHEPDVGLDKQTLFVFVQRKTTDKAAASPSSSVS